MHPRIRQLWRILGGVLGDAAIPGGTSDFGVSECNPDIVENQTRSNRACKSFGQTPAPGAVGYRRRNR